MDILIERFLRVPALLLLVAELFVVSLAFVDPAVVVDWVVDVVLAVDVVGVAVVVVGLSAGKIGGYAIGTSSPLTNFDTDDPT